MRCATSIWVSPSGSSNPAVSRRRSSGPGQGSELGFAAAELVAAIAVLRVAVVALLVAQRQAVAAVVDEIAVDKGVELAERIAAVERLVGPVVARFAVVNDAVAAGVAELELAELIAAVAILHVAVVALLVAGDDSVAAPAGRGPRPTERVIGGQTALGGALARGATVTLLTRIEHAVATQ